LTTPVLSHGLIYRFSLSVYSSVLCFVALRTSSYENALLTQLPRPQGFGEDWTLTN
jgi:hypothetical protein